MAVRSSHQDTGTFVGRARELTAADQIIDEREQTGVILIGGESGIGKSRLASEIIARRTPMPSVAHGAALPRAGALPFELVDSALGAPTTEASRASGVSHASSVRNTPDLAEQLRRRAEQLRMLADGPTIYLFEDIQWADANSLDVIERLIVAGPLDATIIATYRPNALQPGHPAQSFLQRSERRRLVVQFRLEPLRRNEVETYLAAEGRAVSPAIVEHVHGRTGGNPLLLSELVSLTEPEADLTGGLPWTLAELLRPEIDRLPEPERRVVEAVAVLGPIVEFDLVAIALGVDESALVDQLRALIDRGVLVESGPDRFGFRHDMVGEAVVSNLFEREQRRIHGAVHDALMTMETADPAVIATHAARAGRTRAAAEAARQAAVEALAAGRTHRALMFAEQALLEFPDDTDLLRIAVVASWRTGQDRVGLHHLDAWRELAASAAEQAEVLHHHVRLSWEVGDVDGADAAAEELTLLMTTCISDTVKAQALADLAQHHMLRARGAVAIDLADQAIEVAERAGRAADGARRQALVERGSARIDRDGDRAGAIRELLDVAAEAEAVGDYVVASRALHNVPIQHPSVDAARHVEHMREAGERAGLSCMANDTYRRQLLRLAELEGDREAFETQLETAVAELAHIPKMHRIAAEFALEAGDVADARRHARSLPLDIETGHVSGAWRTGIEALADLVEFDEPESLRSWFGSLGTAHLAEDYALELSLRHLDELLAAGCGPAIRSFLEREMVDRLDEPGYLGIRAEIDGDGQAAAELYEQALVSGMTTNAFEQTQLHLGLARLADVTGADAAASHRLAATERIGRWPGRLHDRVAALRSNRADGHGAAGAGEQHVTLTPREREVAQLVTRGLTNGGIAEELFISTKTASVHVSNILAKLAMSSRTEIAAWVAQGGLEPAAG